MTAAMSELKGGGGGERRRKTLTVRRRERGEGANACAHVDGSGFSEGEMRDMCEAGKNGRKNRVGEAAREREGNPFSHAHL